MLPVASRGFIALLILTTLLLLLAACGEDERALSAIETQKKTAEVERELQAVGPAPADLDLAIDRDANALTLSWPSLLPGDYNLTGNVDGLDLFPLAANFNRDTGEQAGLECIDGNNDGLLSGLDLFTISVNFQQRIDGYDVFWETGETGDFSQNRLNQAAGPVAYIGCGGTAEYLSYNEGYGPWYAVRSWDEAASQHSAPTTPAGVPSAPAELWASNAGVGPAVSLDWDNLGDETDTWRVYRSLSSDGPWERLTDIPRDSSNYFDAAAGEDGALIWYTITTVDEHGVESFYGAKTSVTTPEWNSTYQYAGGAGYYNAIAVNQDGEPLMPYYINGTGIVLAAYQYQPGMWSAIQLDTAGFCDGWPSVAFDNMNQPWICYGYESGLKVAQHDGDDWNNGWTFHGASMGGGKNCSLASRQDGAIGVSHHNGGSLFYTSWDGSQWTTETVDSGVEGETSLVFDYDSNPVISYRKDTGLSIAWHDGASWNLHDAHLATEVGWGSSVAIAEDGSPWAVYQLALQKDLSLARWNGTGFDIETIDGDGVAVGRYTALEFDKLRHRAVVAYTGESGVNIACLNGQDWSITPVEGLPETAKGPLDMSLNGRGLPVISVYDPITEGLWVCLYQMR